MRSAPPPLGACQSAQENDLSLLRRALPSCPNLAFDARRFSEEGQGSLRVPNSSLSIYKPIQNKESVTFRYNFCSVLMLDNYALVFGVCVLVCLYTLCYFVVGYLHATSGSKQVRVLSNILNCTLLFSIHIQISKIAIKTGFIGLNNIISFFTGFSPLLLS